MYHGDQIVLATALCWPGGEVRGLTPRLTARAA